MNKPRRNWLVIGITIVGVLVLAYPPTWGQLTTAAGPDGYAHSIFGYIADRFNGVINVKDPAYGARCDGSSFDDTSAFVAAIQAAGSQKAIHVPKGTCKITSELLFAADRFRFYGDGINITILNFAPTANGSMIKVSKGASITFQPSIHGMTLTSQDTTYTKVALDIWDVSEMQIRDLSIAGANSYWRGNGSIGLRTQGREFTTIKNVTIFAEKPMVLADNPNHTIDMDHFHFQDLYLAGYSGTNYPLITANSGMNITNTTFDGAQAWVGGAGGFYWNDTTSSISSYALTFKNVRDEQTTDANSWLFYFGRNQSLYGLRLENIYVDPNHKGIYLRNVFGATLDNYTFTGSGVALDYNGSNWGLDGRGCFFLGGSTVTIAGQNLVHAGPKYPVTAPLPSSFRFHNAALVTQTTFSSTAVTQPIITVANNGTAVLGGSTMTGTLLVTSSAGDSAMVSIGGAAATTVEMSDPGSKFSVTQGTASSTNISWVSGTARYTLENKSGASLNYSLMFMGAYEGF